MVTITQGANIAVSSYFNILSYSISGGSLNCNLTNTGSLSLGTHSAICTATGGNGLTAQSYINIMDSKNNLKIVP